MTAIAPAIRLHREGESKALAVGRLVEYPVEDRYADGSVIKGVGSAGLVGVFAGFDAGALDGTKLSVQIVDTGEWLKPHGYPTVGSVPGPQTNGEPETPTGLLQWAADNKIALLFLSEAQKENRIPSKHPLVAFDERSDFQTLAGTAASIPNSMAFATGGSSAATATPKPVAGSAEAIRQAVASPQHMAAALGVEKIKRASAAPPSDKLSKVQLDGLLESQHQPYHELNNTVRYSAGGIWCWFFRWQD